MPSSAASTARRDRPFITATSLKEESQAPKPSPFLPQSSAQAGAVAKMATAATNAKALNFFPKSRVPRRKSARCESPLSHPGNMHDFDDFDPAARHLEMRMIFAEHLRRISCSFGLNDRIAADVVFRIGSSLCVALLGLSKRRAAVDHGRLVVAHPFHPRIHALLLLLGSGFLHHPLKVSPIGHVQDHELFHQQILPVAKIAANV